MKIPILGLVIDERFLEHRRRSTSYASIVGGWMAIGLFAYRYFVNGVWSWDLFTVGATIAVVKLSLLVWYLSTE
jgi:hypothetical protein